MQPMVAMFYLNESSVVNGLQYRLRGEGSSEGFVRHRINDDRFVAQRGSTLAAYWPFIALQSPNGNVQLLFFDGRNPWTTTSLATAIESTRLAVVPTSRSADRITWDGWVAVFYQAQEGRIRSLVNPQSIDPSDELADLTEIWEDSKHSLRGSN
jgi:hypothetical protein